MPRSTHLAINGGEPVRKEPFPAWPYYDPASVEHAQQVLRSGNVNYWTGSEGQEFERAFAEYLGAEYSVALANGSLALEMALYGLGIGPGDEVIVPCRSFVATASSVVVRGAMPVFADVDPNSQNITAETIKAALTERTRAVVIVHLAGWPCDIGQIRRLAKEKGLWIIEDCAQAHGARIDGKPVGSLGDAAAFSFCQDKIMSTAGEGGMLVTPHEDVWRRVWAYKDHGKDYEKMQHQAGTGLKWVHDSFGSNLRLTELQSAIGRYQLNCLDEWVGQRRRNSKSLSGRLREMPGLRVTEPDTHVFHSYYKYYTFVRPEQLTDHWDRDRIIEAIRAEGVPCYYGVCPEIYLEKAFAEAGFEPRERFRTARELGRTSLCFLVHPTAGESEMNDTVNAVEKVLDAATI